MAQHDPCHVVVRGARAARAVLALVRCRSGTELVRVHRYLGGCQSAQHVAHHDHRRAGQPGLGDAVLQVAQRGRDVPLVRQARMLDDGHRRVARQALQQFASGCARRPTRPCR